MLTESDLRRLLAGGEQFTVEFVSESGGPLAEAQLADAVVCLANGRGGVVLVGVEEDGRLTGARRRHGDYTDPRRVELAIAGRTVPSCPVECSVASLDGVELLIIEVPDGRPVTSTSDGVYRRRGTDAHGRPVCVPYLSHEMQSREATRGALDFTALVVPEARWEDLDPLEIERVRRTVARNRGRADATLLDLSDRDLVQTLGWVESGGGAAGGIRVAGLLMVGREEAIQRYIPNHEVAFQVLRGTRVAVNEFVRWPLIRVAEEIGLRFDARNHEEELTVGPVRVGIPAYSPAGFREALHNALVHRDYTRIGAVHVQWREDQAGEGVGEIEISNPGGFLDNVGLANLLVAAPRPRNPVLADAFKRIGLVERTGRGIDTIFDGQLRYGRQLPDYSRSTVATVHVVLYDGPPDIPFSRLVIERDVPGRRLSVDEMLVLNAMARDQEPMGIGRAAGIIQRMEGPARAVLDRLVESGLVDGWEDRRERVYYFTSAVARALGVADMDEDVAQEEAGQRERKILDYVDLHGRITRSVAADLCGLEGREARGVLEKLVKRGELVVRGEKRGAHYARVGTPAAESDVSQEESV